MGKGALGHKCESARVRDCTPNTKPVLSDLDYSTANSDLDLEVVGADSQPTQLDSQLVILKSGVVPPVLLT